LYFYEELDRLVAERVYLESSLWEEENFAFDKRFYSTGKAIPGNRS
jgi:hypothetical protein